MKHRQLPGGVHAKTRVVVKNTAAADHTRKTKPTSRFDVDPYTFQSFLDIRPLVWGVRSRRAPPPDVIFF
jgi:hypothetical protein